MFSVRRFTSLSTGPGLPLTRKTSNLNPWGCAAHRDDLRSGGSSPSTSSPCSLIHHQTGPQHFSVAAAVAPVKTPTPGKMMKGAQHTSTLRVSTLTTLPTLHRLRKVVQVGRHMDATGGAATTTSATKTVKLGGVCPQHASDIKSKPRSNCHPCVLFDRFKEEKTDRGKAI